MLPSRDVAEPRTVKFQLKRKPQRAQPDGPGNGWLLTNPLQRALMGTFEEHGGRGCCPYTRRGSRISNGAIW
jgi:hypothetical protein